MPRIFDCHIHLYPPAVFADPLAWARAQGEPGWAAAVAPAGRRTLQGWADVGRLLTDMDRAGVEQCVLLGWYWEEQATCDLQNEWFRGWTQAHPDRLRAFAAVQPAAGERAVQAVERALDAGFCGIGELLAPAQRFDLAGDAWSRIAALAGRRGVPVTFHVTDPLLPATVAPPTPLLDYLELAQRFPATTFILAHWGGGLPFFELNPRVRAALRNVYYDTAASPLLYDPAIFRRVVDLIGADRVLYGSDYPLLLYPRLAREPDFARFLGEIAAAGLTAAEAEQILGGNLRRLLGR